MASFSLYQLLVPAFAAIMLLRAGSEYLRHRRSLRELAMWTAVWVGVSLVALFPDFSIRSLARLTGTKDGLNALVFFVLIVLSYGCLRLYVRLDAQQRTITGLVRRLAIRDVFGDDAPHDPPPNKRA